MGSTPLVQSQLSITNLLLYYYSNLTNLKR
jgi:hypothetical protein